MAILKIKFLILCLLHFLCVFVSGKMRSFNIGDGEIPPSSSQMGQIYLRVYSTCTLAIPFEFGTPAQHFNLSFDFFTSSTTLYLQNIPYEQISNADPPVYNRNIFSPNASSTFKNLSTTIFSDFMYGKGYLAEDYVNNALIWKEQKSRMDFMLITKAGIEGMDLPYIPVDGYLGLEPERMTSFGIPSFMYWLTQKSGDNSSSITFYLNKFNSYDPDDTKKSSYAVVDFFGGGIPSYCNANEWFFSTMPNQNTMWALMAKSITMESKSGNSSTVILSENQVTLIEPTFFLTRIPSKQMDVLNAIVGAREVEDFHGVYQLNCNSTKTAPTIKFLFVNSNGDQLLIKFEPEEYIIPSEFGDCQLIFTKNPDLKGHEYWLGYSFFQKHCFQLKYNVHSDEKKDERIVGIATKRMKNDIYEMAF